MTAQHTHRDLDLVDTLAGEGGSCGCGGCGCGSAAAGQSTGTVTDVSASPDATTTAYAVTGLTCGHCAGAVTSELTALEGVVDVRVDVVAGGTSTVTVTSRAPLDDTQVATALGEAGDYQLA